MTTPQAPEAPVPQPTQGGSYLLDPDTQQLVRVQYTRTAAEVPAEQQPSDQPTP